MLEFAANVASHLILYCKQVVSNSAMWTGMGSGDGTTYAVSLRDLMFD